MADPPSFDEHPADRLQRACAELIRRLRAGERRPSETLLAAMPDLAADAELALELIYTEFATREQLGEQPEPQEFFDRFPALAPALARQLEIHALLAEAGDEQHASHPSSASDTQPAIDDSPAGEVREVGDYRILAEVARGAMGVVFKAQHQKLGRVVALKLLHGSQPAAASQPPRDAPLARFRDEARLMAALRHPNIVHIDEIGEDAAGCPFLACEWVDGGTLAQQTGGRPMDCREAARRIRTLAEAVDCAHRLGILHCDLSPANVLLTADGIPKIADFGLARLRRDEAQPGEAAVLAGTPAYMAPEQVCQPERIGPATDIYALGAILYELLIGRPPFYGRAGWETLNQVVAHAPQPLRRSRPAVPRDLDAICLKCLAKEPAGRYLSAAQLAADLDRWLAGQPVVARRVGPVEWLWKAAARRPLTAAALAVALLAASAFVIGGVRYNALLRSSLWQTARQESKIRTQADELAARLDASRCNIFAMQLTQAETILRQSPAQAIELLRDETRCPRDLRDFAWGLLYHRSAQDRQTLHGASPGVLAMRMPEKQGVIAVDRTGTVTIWIADSMVAKTRRLWPAAQPTCIALSANGRYLAGGGEDYTIRICDLQQRKADILLHGHRERITALALTADASRALSGSQSGEVRLWDVQAQTSKSVRAAEAPVVAVAFSPRGDRIAAAATNGVIRVWKTADLALEHEFAGHAGGMFDLAFAADGRILLAGGAWSGQIDLWDLTAGKRRNSISVQGSQLRCMATSPAGTLLAAAAADRSIRIWNLETGVPQTILHGHGHQIDCVAFSADGKSLVSAAEDGTVKLWDVNQRPTPRVLEVAGAAVLAVAYSPDGRSLATAGLDRVVRLWDTADSRQLRTLTGHECAVRAVRFSRTGKYLASGGEDGQVRLWQSASGKELAVWQHPSWVTDLEFSPDEQTVATVATDGGVRMWNVAGSADQAAANFGNPQTNVNAIRFSPDGRLLATANRDETIALWDVRQRQQVSLLRGHGGSVVAVAFSPDGRRLASAGEDETVRIWNVAGLALLATMRGHTQPINSLAFTSDGRTLASGTGSRWGGEPGEVILWDAAAGHLHATLREQDGPVTFAPNGQTLVTCQYTEIALWEAAPYQSASDQPEEHSGAR